MDPEHVRRTVRHGGMLFGLFWLLYAGGVGIALLYLHFQ
jgi:hypothetical protein